MNWMGALPEWMHAMPLSTIAIPGSHDSGTYGLDPTGPFAPDQPAKLAAILATFGCIARPIVYRWSVTQTLTFSEQLKAGIRYLDLRISSGPSAGEYSVVHGLFGPEIRECLEAVMEFSLKNLTEVVILDLNHFYQMSPADHHALLQIIVDRLGNLMVPFSGSAETLTLESLWKTPARVICFYQNGAAGPFLKYFWPSPFICSPWPNVTQDDQLISYLERRYERGPNPPRIFYGTQGLVTPDTKTIIRRWTSSLKSTMALKATARVVDWTGLHAEGNWFNIVLADFVESSNFIEKIIALNYSKKEHVSQDSRGKELDDSELLAGGEYDTR